MLTDHSPSLGSTSTIEHIVLKSPRAYVIHSQGDGFGAYVERLINVAHEAHQSFNGLIRTLPEFIGYLRDELDRSYGQYQFTIVAGKHFDSDPVLSNCSALVELAGLKVLIFSSIGCSYKLTGDATHSLPW